MYFSGTYLSKIFCPGSGDETSSRAQLGLSFVSQTRLNPEDPERYNWSLQAWLDQAVTLEGHVVQDGWCFNKPATGECPYQDGHVCRQWLIQLPVVWIVDLNAGSVSSFLKFD